MSKIKIVLHGVSLMKIIKDTMTNAYASIPRVCGGSRVALTEGASREGWLPRAAGAAVLGGSDISYALFVQVSNVDNSAIKKSKKGFGSKKKKSSYFFLMVSY